MFDQLIEGLSGKQIPDIDLIRDYLRETEFEVAFSLLMANLKEKPIRPTDLKRIEAIGEKMKLSPEYWEGLRVTS